MASLDDIRKAMGGKPISSADPTPLNAEQQAKLNKYISAQQAHKQAVANSLGSTRKSIEQDGYLYHYAPREARESILAEGLMPSKGVTRDTLDNGLYFFTKPNDAPSAIGVMGVTGRVSADSPGLDLYRVKVEPGMLDDMLIDEKLPIRGNIASAVVVPTKTGSFIPELIGENARFESSGEAMDLFSKASYDPLKPINNRRHASKLRFEVDGKAYFLHHSKADLKVGEKIQRTGAFKQSTAGDALYGYSYGWDAMNPSSVNNAIYNQSGARNIYITSAEADQVFPDLNVINSNARAIKGEQTILDRITIQPNETFEEANARIMESLKKLNIPMRTKQEEKMANMEMTVSERGTRAAQDYADASAETKLRELAQAISEKHSIYEIPDNLDDMLKEADGFNFIQKTPDGRFTTRNLEAPVRARAYEQGGLEGLRAEVIKQEGSFKNFARKLRPVEEFEELASQAGKAAGKELGFMSKRTLSGLVKAGEIAAQVMRSRGSHVMDFL